MKRPTVSATCGIVLTMLLLIVKVGHAQESAIQWFNNVNAASELAQTDNRPMMIEFWADWCAPCRIMDAEIWPDPELAAAVGEKLVAVRISFDIQTDVVRRYGVEVLPHLLFTNSHGTPLMDHRGFLEAEDLTAVVNALPGDVSELNRLDRILQEDDDHFESLAAMGDALGTAGFVVASNVYYDKAVSTREARTHPRREAVLGGMGQNYLILQDGKKAVEVFERCLEDFPDSPNRPEYLRRLEQGRQLIEAGL